MKTTQSVAIIGGGLAGLCAAARLSKQGLRVRLFEANAKLGGFCAATTLDGYTFNDGALYLALPGILERVFERLGLDRASLLPLRRITAAQTVTLPDGAVVTIAAGPRVTVERPAGAVDAARLEAELDALLRKWTPVLRLFADDITIHPFSLSRLLLRGWRVLPKLRGTVAAELSRAIHDPAARAALSGVLLFTGLPPQQTPISSLLGLVSLLTEGFHLPEGGMGRIPDVLSQAVTHNGGEVILNARVNRIVVTDGRVRGLDVDGRGVIEADAVISTASGMATFAALLSPADVPAAVRRKVETAPLSHKGLLLQLGLANRIDAPSHSMNVLPYMEEQSRIFVPARNDVPWPIYSVPTVTMPELAPPGGSIVEMFPPIDQALPAGEWTAEMKAEVAATAIRALSRRHELRIAVQRVVSPKELQDGMHLYRGALYGLSPAADPRALFPHRTPVPGLFLAGQTTWPGYGVVTSAMSGLFAADAVLETDRR